jgi:adenine/guanine phosphoribosyltransferase-like PRPP-binding protein
MKSANPYFSIAKRLHNAKRQYLLVNPKQAKHVPVSPAEALDMMGALCDLVKAHHPEIGLVIGFAETATAIGASVAAGSAGCVYLQTTREDIAGEDYLSFDEEHSHAVEQRLYTARLEAALMSTQTVAFVDDEISTGKTIRNMVAKIEQRYPLLRDKKKVLASIINRTSDEDARLLREAGFDCVQLVRLPNNDYTVEVAQLPTRAPETAPCDAPLYYLRTERLPMPLDPRLGVDIDDYLAWCRLLAADVAHYAEGCRRIAVLGTEECMLPALYCARHIEERYPTAKVVCHATTRSPICISAADGYPIANGYVLGGFYDVERTTYIYNIAGYDLVLVISDSRTVQPAAQRALAACFAAHGCDNLVMVSATDGVRKGGADE